MRILLELEKWEPYPCPGCGEKLLKHIQEEGARYHVFSWDTNGRHCSEKQCEENHKCHALNQIGGKWR